MTFPTATPTFRTDPDFSSFPFLFTSLFYKNFLEMDRTARRLFEGVSMVRQAQALMYVFALLLRPIHGDISICCENPYFVPYRAIPLLAAAQGKSCPDLSF